jgi:hypothetical protein
VNLATLFLSLSAVPGLFSQTVIALPARWIGNKDDKANGYGDFPEHHPDRLHEAKGWHIRKRMASQPKNIR